MKKCAIVWLWTGLLVSTLPVRLLWLLPAFSAVGIGVTIHLCRMRIGPDDTEKEMTKIDFLLLGLAK
jgi:hypothetical protein